MMTHMQRKKHHTRHCTYYVKSMNEIWTQHHRPLKESRSDLIPIISSYRWMNEIPTNWAKFWYIVACIAWCVVPPPDVWSGHKFSPRQICVGKTRRRVRRGNLHLQLTPLIHPTTIPHHSKTHRPRMESKVARAPIDEFGRRCRTNVIVIR